MVKEGIYIIPPAALVAQIISIFSYINVNERILTGN